MWDFDSDDFIDEIWVPGALDAPRTISLSDSFSYDTSGTFVARVVVTDIEGLADSATTTVTATPALPQVEQIGALTVPGSPSAIRVDEARGRVYVSDAGTGTIHVFDENTLGTIATIDGCHGALSNDEFVIDTTYMRLYAGCNQRGFTTGIPSGDGRIRVIDMATDAIDAVIDLGTQDRSEYILAIDNVRHKVYVSHSGNEQGSEIAVIDVATNAVTTVAIEGAGTFGSLSVNETTNKVYIVRERLDDMIVLDGSTLAVSPPFEFEFRSPLQSGINQGENKLYVKTLFGPGGRPTICILELNLFSPSCTNIAGNDWGGIVTNEETSRVYLGVEVGDRIGILDGATNSLQEIPMESGTGPGGATNQSHKVIVNESTNHVFFVDSEFLLALDGATGEYRKIAYANAESASGLLLSAIAINRQSNRIYVAYNGANVNKVAVFRDPPRAVTPFGCEAL